MKRKSIVILSSVLILFLSLTLFCACDNSDAPAPTDDTLHLSDVLPWLNELSADDVTEINMKKGYYGVVPGTPINVTTITGETISSFLNAYKYATVAEKEYKAIDGGSYTIVKLTLSKGETKTFTISNGSYYDSENHKYYSVAVSDKIESDNVVSALAFSVYESVFPVYKNDSKIGSITDVGEWQFTRTDAPASVSDAPTHKVVVDFGDILIYNDTLFCLQNIETQYWYQLYGMTFTEILSRMSAEA